MNNLPIIYTITYNDQVNKIRLDKFLALNLPTLSRTKVLKLIKMGLMQHNGKHCTDGDIKLTDGDIIKLEVPNEESFELHTHDINLDIIYEDDDLLIINKHAGITVHPGAGNHNDTLVNALMNTHKGNLSNSADIKRPGIVHRLDKDTTGLLIVAKNDSSHYKLSSMLANRVIARSYLAIVYGTPQPAVSTITTQYGRSKRDHKKMCVLRTGGKTAITNYNVIEKFCGGALSLIECKLQTGRTHQIRVHMEHISHPIVGDQTYGRSLNFNLNALSETQKDLTKQFPRQALHAHKLAFIHPKTDKHLEFTAPLPNDFKTLVDILK